MIREGKKIQKLSPRKIHGPVAANHWLILNLSFSDFLMGIYLISLGIAGLRLSGRFCQHQLEWCSGVICEAMGSLAIIASEASVLTMVMLTAFRLYTVFNVSRTKKNLFTFFLQSTVQAFEDFATSIAKLNALFHQRFVFAFLHHFFSRYSSRQIYEYAQLSVQF